MSARQILFYAIGLPLIVILLFTFWPPSEKRLQGRLSTRLFSQEGKLLRRFQEAASRGYAEKSPIMPENLIHYLLESEDKRFFYHPGFDPLAICRAFYQNLSSYRRISGASTITQQLARILYANIMPTNHKLRKLAELLLALRLEIYLSKRKILQLYLDNVPLSYNQIGVAAAAKKLFQRAINFLTKEELMALVILMRQNHPGEKRFKKRFTVFYNKITGKIILEDSLELLWLKIKQGASSPNQHRTKYSLHFQDFMQQRFSGSLLGDVNTTLSQVLNEKLQHILNSELSVMTERGAKNGSILVFEFDEEKQRLYLRGLVGSENYNAEEAGQVNGAMRIRSAGSSLKPLLYALAINEFNYFSNTILDDREQSFTLAYSSAAHEGETYMPRNNDLRFWGKLTLREALANSRNVPAVYVANSLGVGSFLRFLKRSGFKHLNRSADVYGPGLALGTGGSSLYLTTRAYSMFINQGVIPAVTVGYDQSGLELQLSPKKNMISADTAAIIAHILSDANMRRKAFGRRNFLDFPYRVAAKTGTSKDYKDAWTIGFTSKYLIGVWIGDFSGKSMRKVSGGWGAGRVFQQIVRHLATLHKPALEFPIDWKKLLLCRKSGMLARPDCPQYEEISNGSKEQAVLCPLSHSFEKNQRADVDSTSKNKVEIKSPTEFETFLIDPHMPFSAQRIPLEVVGYSNESFQLFLDNIKLLDFHGSIKKLIKPQAGSHLLQVMYRGEIVKERRFFVR